MCVLAPSSPSTSGGNITILALQAILSLSWALKNANKILSSLQTGSLYFKLITILTNPPHYCCLLPSSADIVLSAFIKQTHHRDLHTPHPNPGN